MPVLSEWLEEFNDRAALEGVSHRGRPLRAWGEWCRETGENISIDDPKAREIFAWFESRSPKGSLSIPSLFTGAFYFDACFWPVEIPMGYGTVMLDGGDALTTMPTSTKTKLFDQNENFEDFKALWADSLDYGVGLRSLGLAEDLAEFWQRLVVSADRKLRSAVEDLCRNGPGANAMQSSREASEMFLKAFLARNQGLTEEDAKDRKRYGHDLAKATDAILRIGPNPVFGEVLARLACFPQVEDRYSAKQYSGLDLWRAYKVTQAIAAEVVRDFTGGTNNIRAQVATRF